MRSSWRDTLKSGPLSALYLIARNAKRKIRREPLAGTLHTPQTAIPAQDLRALAPAMPDHARLYFSLALAYLDPDYVRSLDETTPVDAAAHRRALACLRCAETLDFESAERIAIYKAWIYSRFGQADAARALVSSLKAWELDSESSLLDKILSGTTQALAEMDSTAGPGWSSSRKELERNTPETLVVFGDPDALTSVWMPESRYLVIDESVTGLTPEAAAQLPIDFKVCIGPPAYRQRAAAAGIQWDRWIAVPEPPTSDS